VQDAGDTNARGSANALDGVFSLTVDSTGAKFRLGHESILELEKRAEIPAAQPSSLQEEFV
jgi:hypothetical protein